MYVTWTALRLERPTPTCPWLPEGALYAQAGQAGAGVATVPLFDGVWWTVVATWADEAAARAAAPHAQVEGDVWHVVLQPASFRGDAVLAGGARPFDALPDRGRTDGASAVITLAGMGPDPARGREFFRRFMELGRDVARAPGARAALVQAPEDGAMLTFSAWETLRSAVTWAYHAEPHTRTLRRQEEHGLAETSGFLRCAVLASSGRLGDRPDPLAGLTGTVRSPALTAQEQS